jgi:hypothetical protein
MTEKALWLLGAPAEAIDSLDRFLSIPESARRLYIKTLDKFISIHGKAHYQDISTSGGAFPMPIATVGSSFHAMQSLGGKTSCWLI